MLNVLCKFSGLVAFPFDDLVCRVEIGGWAQSGSYQGLTLVGQGFTFSSQERSAGSSYQEYSIKNVNATVNLYTYACCPSDPYPVVNYVITVQRAGVFYVLMFIVPSLLLTMLSFSVFFMSFEVGERLGFGITLVLTFEVTKTIVMEFVPVCGEVLWIDLFLMVNEYFAILALLESWLVLFLAYHSDDHIIPSLFLPPASFISAVSWWLGMPPPSKRLWPPCPHRRGICSPISPSRRSRTPSAGSGRSPCAPCAAPFTPRSRPCAASSSAAAPTNGRTPCAARRPPPRASTRASPSSSAATTRPRMRTSRSSR